MPYIKIKKIFLILGFIFTLNNQKYIKIYLFLDRILNFKFIKK